MYFLGTIQGGSGAYNNAATGASGVAGNIFTIPPSAKALYLVPNASGVNFALLATGGTGLTTQTRSAQLNPNAINGPFRVIPGTAYISIYSTGGIVTVGVWMAPTS